MLLFPTSDGWLAGWLDKSETTTRMSFARSWMQIRLRCLSKTVYYLKHKFEEVVVVIGWLGRVQTRAHLSTWQWVRLVRFRSLYVKGVKLKTTRQFIPWMEEVGVRRVIGSWAHSISDWICIYSGTDERMKLPVNVSTERQQQVQRWFHYWFRIGIISVSICRQSYRTRTVMSCSVPSRRPAIHQSQLQ